MLAKIIIQRFTLTAFVCTGEKSYLKTYMSWYTEWFEPRDIIWPCSLGGSEIVVTDFSTTLLKVLIEVECYKSAVC